MKLWKTIVLAALTAAAWTTDWPQWRGPARDGIAPAVAEPKAWPEQLKRSWKVNVGEGHSSPVVSGDKIFVHTRQGEREVVSCLRADSGQVLWSQGYDTPYEMNSAARGHGKGVKSTPVVSGGRLYTLGIAGTLACFDAATGKLEWRKDFKPATFGTAMSPVVDRGMLIADLSTGTGGVLAAFDAQTGAEKWKWTGDGAAYASPIVLELAGTRQVVTQTQKNIVGVAEHTGSLLWRIPFTTAFDQNVVTPVLYRDTLIFSGLNNGVMGVKVLHRGSEWTTETVWQNKDVAMYMNSPVIVGDLLIGLSHRNKGQYFCLDPRTGATQWTSEGRQGDNAAIVAAGSLLLLLNNEGELTIARPNAKSFAVVRKYTVAESQTWAHPVVLEKGVLIKDANTLALWNWL
jgi:outer membrane protein assembly factor BamB